MITATVGVVKSHTEGPKLYSIPVPPSDIGKKFGQLLESNKGTDVNFEVDGEIFAAHKIVLAARSPVFRAQLFGPMKEKNMQCIKVEDIEAPVFKVCPNFTRFFIGYVDVMCACFPSLYSPTCIVLFKTCKELCSAADGSFIMNTISYPS